MLILDRRKHECVFLFLPNDDAILIKVVNGVHGRGVALGFGVPDNVIVMRDDHVSIVTEYGETSPNATFAVEQVVGDVYRRVR